MSIVAGKSSGGNEPLPTPLRDVSPHLRPAASFWLEAIVAAGWSAVLTSDAGDDRNATALLMLAHAGWIDLTVVKFGGVTVQRIAPAAKWMNHADPLVPF